MAITHSAADQCCQAAGRGSPIFQQMFFHRSPDARIETILQSTLTVRALAISMRLLCGAHIRAERSILVGIMGTAGAGGFGICAAVITAAPVVCSFDRKLSGDRRARLVDQRRNQRGFLMSKEDDDAGSIPLCLAVVAPLDAR
jgi:hypothetical protein